MMSPQTEPGSPRRRKVRTVLAWGVHLYTALGLVAAAGIAVLIVEGTAEAYRWAFILMLIATLIDATDGTLARAVRIKETLPGFDGRRLDDLIDFLNYTFLPLFLLWRASILPEGQEIRIWDSIAEVRYLVIPQRPPGTEGMDEEALAGLVTRDAMIGTGLARMPEETSA